MPLEYWLLAALAGVIAVNAWLAVRAARRGLPYLFEAGAHAKVSVGREGVTLREDAHPRTVRWSEISAVRVRTTAYGPLADDLLLELHTTSRVPALTIPSEAKGFDRLLRSIGSYLPGCDMERLVEATMCAEAGEFLVWRGDGDAPDD